jgi:hypothetical protein
MALLTRGPVLQPRRKFEASLNFISGNIKDIQALKLALLVRIEIRDLNKKVLEVTETEVLCSSKMPPYE